MKRTMARTLKYLSLPGLALVTAGLLVGLLQGWGPLSLGLLAGGLGLLVVGLSLSDYGRDRFWSRRSTEVGANALISTLAVLVILGLINLLAVRYNTRIDLTENQLFTLAPQSQQVVQSLGSPVQVVIFDANQNPQDRQLLESYRQAGNKFSFEYVNPYDDPKRAQEFGATQAGAVFLKQGEQRRQLQVLSPSDRLSERTLTNALEQLTQTGSLRVYFTQGHREFPIDGSKTGLQQAANALREKGYTVEPLDLAQTSAVPKAANLVIVAGPAAEFFDNEVKALSTYLAGGGSLLLMIDPRTSPNLDTLLDSWGVSLDNRIVLDTSGSGQLVGLGPAAPLVTDYGDHPITRGFGTGRSFFPLVRPINLEAVPGVTAEPILRSNSQSRAEVLSTKGELQFNQDAAPNGPYTLGAALSRPGKEGGTKVGEDGKPTGPEARLVVIGNATFATDGLFEQQLNGDVFLNAVSWLSQEDDSTLSIRPRQATNRRIVMTVQQQIGLGIFVLLVLPLVGLIMALLLWLKRR